MIRDTASPRRTQKTNSPPRRGGAWARHTDLKPHPGDGVVSPAKAPKVRTQELI